MTWMNLQETHALLRLANVVSPLLSTRGTYMHTQISHKTIPTCAATMSVALLRMFWLAPADTCWKEIHTWEKRPSKRKSHRWRETHVCKKTLIRLTAKALLALLRMFWLDPADTCEKNLHMNKETHLWGKTPFRRSLSVHVLTRKETHV